MNILADTHVLAWWAEDSKQLSTLARQLLSSTSNNVYFSSISIWEVSIKSAQGLWDVNASDLRQGLLDGGFREFPFTSLHAALAGQLPAHHQDPFDRALVAQAMTEPMHLMSQDTQLRSYKASFLDA